MFDRFPRSIRALPRPLLFLALSGLLAAPAVAAKEPLATAHEVASAHALLIWNRDKLAELGIALEPGGVPRKPLDAQYRALEIDLAGKLSFELEHGHVVRTRAGALAFPRPFTLRAGGRTATVALRLAAAQHDRAAFDLIDVAGRVWFSVDYVHQFSATDAIELGNLDVRIGPALAGWARQPASAGRAVGAMHVKLPVTGAQKALEAVSSCQTPNWPGTSGFTFDVQLTDIFDLQAQCSGGCTGTGANPNALVKLVPSTKLSNGGTGDLPWYPQFSTITPPGAYPYATVDQHPFLVWNAYRINGLGQLEQIGRSGLKHAFATANEGCPCGNNNILAPDCSDTYNNFSNDQAYYLAPRSEVIAATGVWGRCHSLFDPDCNGMQDGHDIGQAGRLLVPESELDLAQHPGSVYYIDSWYVVRDDQNIYNTMGFRTFTPTFTGGAWLVTPFQGLFYDGAVIDQWVPPGLPTANMRNSEVVTAKGRMKLAVKVTALGNGSYRYDYALMNFDFGVPVTANAEPNLEVIRNRGLSAFSVPLPSGTSINSTGFFDGDRDTGNEWSASVGGGAVRWDAPAGTSLDWGSMYRFTLVANAPPQAANATLVVAETGAMTDPVAVSIGPSIGDTIFADGME